MSENEFERAGFGDCGREMDVATGLAKYWERKPGDWDARQRAQRWRQTRWSALDARIDGDTTP